MQCAFCKSEMNDGATVCHACARKQPLGNEEKARMWGFVLLGGVALLVFGFLGVAIWNAHEKSVAVDRIVAAAKLCGKGSIMTPDFVRFEIDEMRSGGADEHSAEHMVMFEACGDVPVD